MHTVGKVFLWLSVLAAVGTVALAGKLLDKRNTLTQRLEQLRVNEETLEKEVVAKRAELRKLQQEASQVMLAWDKYWNDVAVNVSQADGSLSASVGSNQNVGVPAGTEPPTLHAFMPTPDGGHIYVGPFKAAAVRENDVALQPTWRIRPQDVANWKSGQWRLRSQVPAITVGHFNEMQTSLTDADRRQIEVTQNLATQDSELTKVKDQLKTRQEELLGFTNPPPKAELLPTEFTKGLVAALAEEEESRDLELLEVDRLRREVKIAYRRQEALIARNQRLAASLPGNPPAKPTESAPAVSSNTPAGR